MEVAKSFVSFQHTAAENSVSQNVHIVEKIKTEQKSAMRGANV